MTKVVMASDEFCPEHGRLAHHIGYETNYYKCEHPDCSYMIDNLQKRRPSTIEVEDRTYMRSPDSDEEKPGNGDGQGLPETIDNHVQPEVQCR
jgi:hypothetical protein